MHQLDHEQISVTVIYKVIVLPGQFLHAFLQLSLTLPVVFSQPASIHVASHKLFSAISLHAFDSGKVSGKGGHVSGNGISLQPSLGLFP